MNKTLSKAFMKRSRLKNKFTKDPNDANKVAFKKQRNFCVSLLKKEKKNYYNNLDIHILNDNRTFWKRINPPFSDKNKTLPKDIILIENDKVISERYEVANKLNHFFVDAIGNLDIEPYIPLRSNETLSENIEDIIKKYESHPSVIKMKENVTIKDKFHSRILHHKK